MTLTSLPFDLSAATKHLAARDEKLAELIANTAPFPTSPEWSPVAAAF